MRSSDASALLPAAVEAEGGGGVAAAFPPTAVGGGGGTSCGCGALIFILPVTPCSLHSGSSRA